LFKMPAKRATASAQCGAAQKKPKLSGEVAGVMEAITAAEHLSPACKQMLLAGCPGSLGEYADKRHAHQELVVSLIGHVLGASQEALEAKLAEEQSMTFALETKKVELASAVQEAEEVLKAKAEQTEILAKELQAVTETMMMARRTLEEAKAVHAVGEQRLTELTKEKAHLENSVQQHLAVVQAGDTDAVHGDALVALASQLGLDESLRAALPRACAKAVGERGTFDSLVLTELEQVLQKRVAQLGADMATEESVLSERATAVQAAGLAVEESSAAQGLKASEVTAAQQVQQEQEFARSSAAEAEAAFVPLYDQGVAAKDAVKDELNAFTSYTCECYSLLKDRVTKVPCVEKTVANVDNEMADKTMVETKVDVKVDSKADVDTNKIEQLIDIQAETAAELGA